MKTLTKIKEDYGVIRTFGTTTLLLAEKGKLLITRDTVHIVEDIELVIKEDSDGFYVSSPITKSEVVRWIYANINDLRLLQNGQWK